MALSNPPKPDPNLRPCTDAAGHTWSDAEVSCEDCGEHPGVGCDTCWQMVDLIFYDDPRDFPPLGE